MYNVCHWDTTSFSFPLALLEFFLLEQVISHSEEREPKEMVPQHMSRLGADCLPSTSHQGTDVRYDAKVSVYRMKPT